jgi:hypothetical protein
LHHCQRRGNRVLLSKLTIEEEGPETALLILYVVACQVTVKADAETVFVEGLRNQDGGRSQRVFADLSRIAGCKPSVGDVVPGLVPEAPPGEVQASQAKMPGND